MIRTLISFLTKRKAPEESPPPGFPATPLNRPFVYVCSDIHGEIERYRRMIQEIDFSADNELYILGDVIDRYPHGVEILQDIMDRPNVHMLMGNHEDLCLRALSGDAPADFKEAWVQNDGQQTYQELTSLPANERFRILAYLAELPDCLDIEVGGRKFHLVHVFPSNNPKDRLWYRPNKSTPNPFSNKRTVIVGHTPVFYLPGAVSQQDFFLWLRGAMGEEEHFKSQSPATKQSLVGA